MMRDNLKWDWSRLVLVYHRFIAMAVSDEQTPSVFSENIAASSIACLEIKAFEGEDR